MEEHIKVSVVEVVGHIHFLRDLKMLKATEVAREEEVHHTMYLESVRGAIQWKESHTAK